MYIGISTAAWSFVISFAILYTMNLSKNFSLRLHTDSEELGQYLG